MKSSILPPHFLNSQHILTPIHALQSIMGPISNSHRHLQQTEMIAFEGRLDSYSSCLLSLFSHFWEAGSAISSSGMYSIKVISPRLMSNCLSKHGALLIRTMLIARR